MDWHALLGLPLPMAQEKLRQAGVEAEICVFPQPPAPGAGRHAPGGTRHAGPVDRLLFPRRRSGGNGVKRYNEGMRGLPWAGACLF